MQKGRLILNALAFNQYFIYRNKTEKNYRIVYALFIHCTVHVQHIQMLFSMLRYLLNSTINTTMSSNSKIIVKYKTCLLCNSFRCCFVRRIIVFSILHKLKLSYPPSPFITIEVNTYVHRRMSGYPGWVVQLHLICMIEGITSCFHLKCIDRHH